MLKYCAQHLERWCRVLAPLAALAAPALGFAHGPETFSSLKESSQSVWTAWTFPPLVTTNLILASLIYGIGVRRLWRRAGVGSGVGKRQVGAFSAGMLVMVLALVSPIDALSDELGWMHMIQHMLLMNVAAPLLVLGSPGLAFLWMLPLRQRRWLGGFKKRSQPGRALFYMLWQPLMLWALFALTLWVWHLPSLYERALRHELFHDFQHITFLVAACLFWRLLLDPVSRLRLSRIVAVLYLFFTSLHATLLGVFMALAPGVWYRTYESRTIFWDLSALQDQQIAGLIMWMPACMMYAIVAAVALALWIEKSSRQVEPAVREGVG